MELSENKQTSKLRNINVYSFNHIFKNTPENLEKRRQSIEINEETNELLSKHKPIANFFSEALYCYYAGFYNASFTLLCLLIEYILKKSLGKDRAFGELIDEIFKNDSYPQNMKHYLHAFRLDRNTFFHELSTNEISENNNMMYIILTINIIQQFKDIDFEKQIVKEKYDRKTLSEYKKEIIIWKAKHESLLQAIERIKTSKIEE